VRAISPFSYYSDRAIKLLDEDFWNVALEPSPPASTPQDEPVARALARLDLLREIGWDEAASYELARTRRHFAPYDGALYTLAEGLNQRGFTSTGIGMAWDIYRREGAWNLRLLRIVYPFPYQDIIVAEAAERGVDPFLAAGLIRQESMFNPRAVSGAGAVGLMQVMPATARTLARGLGVKAVTTDLLRKPDVNVHLGMRYLADQLRTWDGRLVPVLAAYNAGPSRLERWRRFPEWGRDQLFTERIPFEETRDYVKIVQHNASMYRALYGNTVATEAVGE
jgi:soluble lytic murein transglycosylase